jgi:hypothetical protein
MSKFNEVVNKIFEGITNGSFDRPGQGTGPNIDSRGVVPSGFKGSGPQGIAPGKESTLLIKLNKKKDQRTPEKKV